MRILLIGGTGFTGPAVIHQLLERGHDVTFLHRGQTEDERTSGAREIIGDRRDGVLLTRAVTEASPDVLVDMIPYTAKDAEVVRQACRGVVPRVVALSSIDVYLAFGRIKNTEPGPLQPTPLTETSALRETNQPGGPDCDKIAVERTYRDDPELPATILRLPAIHGEKDKYRRFRSYLKRMDDGRRFILLGESIAGWKFSRGYVENIAHAIVLAIESPAAAGEVFNVAEPRAMTELSFVQAIGEAAGWDGEVNVLPDAQLPRHLQTTENFEQDWDVSSEKIRTALGYAEIVPRPEAFRRTVQWERDHPLESEPFEINYIAEDEAISQADRRGFR